MEVNVVDPISRKGYRFKGTGEVFIDGSTFEAGVAAYRQRGVTSPIRAIVVIRIERAAPLVSPVYDAGLTEAEVRANWERYWAELRGRETTATGE